ncbi:MAG: glycerate kinase [Hyphomicrobiaceae bacterium]
MSAEARGLLLEMFDAAVAATHPRTCLAPHLPPMPAQGRLIVLCAGKAAIAMASVAEAYYGAAGIGDRLTGVATAPHGYAAAFSGPRPVGLQVLEGRHPTPDGSSLAAAERALALARSAEPDDTVLVLLSGGASALWAAPAEGLELAEKTALTRGLLKSGADIHEMNAVRRHLSRIKGGRLRAAAAAAGTFITLAISDVPGDDPATIGSGPTVADPTTLADARKVISRRIARMTELGLPVPTGVNRALENPANETPKPGAALFARDIYEVVATPVAALEAAGAIARSRGYAVLSLGDQVTGEARDVALAHAALASKARADGRRLAIISGGELEVTVRNRAGRGGRSQEYALALACALDGLAGITALAADTDGIDGGEGRVDDPAGAVIGPDTLVRARARHVDARKALDNNDATTLFAALGDLVHTGPTHTNVNDFRVILVEPA